jgi:hypothetical protein
MSCEYCGKALFPKENRDLNVVDNSVDIVDYFFMDVYNYVLLMLMG